MPIYDTTHVEYATVTGRISIVMDDGSQLPAYWSHPQLGTKFPGIALLHDWWGFDDIVRRVANYFATMGYYVIVPDLFDGHKANTPTEAMKLVEAYKDNSYMRVDTTLSVLEKHHQGNSKVAAIGLGMGGSLAFEAAIQRKDLEAAVAFGGFPQSYLGHFKDAPTPILALYGTDEPYTKPVVIEQLRKELASSSHKAVHQVEVIEGVRHQFFGHDVLDSEREAARQALNITLAFLETHIGKAARPPSKPTV